MAGFIVMGVVLIAVGVLLLYGHNSRRASMIEYQGTVIGLREKMQKKSHLLVKVYCPVVKYNNGKRDITADHHSYDQLMGDYREGDLVAIFADPRLPKIFYFPEENGRTCNEAIAAFAGGGALIAVAAIFGILAG